MDPARKEAYRMLLAGAATQTRALLTFPTDFLTLKEQARAAWRLADLVHNLASFSARDFRGFDEDTYWRQAGAVAELEKLLRRFGDRGAFERDLRRRRDRHRRWTARSRWPRSEVR